MAGIYNISVFDDGSRTYYFGDTKDRKKVLLGHYLRPAPGGIVSDTESEKQREAIRLVSGCFREVLAATENKSHIQLTPSYDKLRKYSYMVYNSQVTYAELKEQMTQDVQDELGALDKHVEPFGDQITAKDSTPKEVAAFLLKIGVRQSAPAVFFMPNDIINALDKRPGLTIFGIHAELTRSIFVNEKNSDPFRLRATIAHECMHFNSRTSLPVALNEGLTQYFTTLFLMGFHGFSEPSAGSVISFAKGLSDKGSCRNAYGNNLAVAAHIVEKAGLYAVIQAYFYGDTPALIKGLGEDRWSRMFFCSLNDNNVLDERTANFLIMAIGS